MGCIYKDIIPHYATMLGG